MNFQARMSPSLRSMDQNRKNGLRLGFAFVPLERLEDGIRLIADEVRKLL